MEWEYNDEYIRFSQTGVNQMSDLIFANLLLRETINDARSDGIQIPKLTVYKYPGMSRGDYHTYQVYAETGDAEHRRVVTLGDYGGY